MPPVLQTQSCSLRLPNRRDQARFDRDTTVSCLVTALMPLFLLIPIIGTPRDPEVPRFIAVLIAMELGIVLLFRGSAWLHRSSRIYFELQCSRCFRRLSWKLGSAKSGLDRRGAFRCGCGALHSYERINPGMVEVKPVPAERLWIGAMARMIPRAWADDE